MYIPNLFLVIIGLLIITSVVILNIIPSNYPAVLGGVTAAIYFVLYYLKIKGE